MRASFLVRDRQRRGRAPLRDLRCFAHPPLFCHGMSRSGEQSVCEDGCVFGRLCVRRGVEGYEGGSAGGLHAELSGVCARGSESEVGYAEI